MPWAAIIGAIVQAGAAYYNNKKADERAEDANRPGPSVANPYYEPFMARMFAVLDQYLANNDLIKYIPKDRMPFELQSPEQQQAIYNQIGTAAANGGPVPPAGLMPPPPLYVPTQEVKPGGDKPKGSLLGASAGNYGSANDNVNHFGQAIQDRQSSSIIRRPGMPTTVSESGHSSPAVQAEYTDAGGVSSTPSAPEVVEVNGAEPTYTDTGTTTTASDGSTTNALIGAGGSVIGTYLANQGGGGKGGVKTTVNPYYEPFMARMMAVLDGYLTDHGITAFIPKDRMPFELQSPEQQQAIYNQIGTAAANGGPVPPAGLMPPPPLYVPTQEVKPGGDKPKGSLLGASAGNYGSANDNVNHFGQAIQDRQPVPLDSDGNNTVVNGPKGDNAIESPRNPEMTDRQSYSASDLAAQIAARRMGIEQAPAFETPASTYAQNQKMSQEELQSLYRYVYGPG